MKELTRFELAVCKRTAQNTKSLRTKRDKLVAKIEANQSELETINTMIEKFEQPIKEMTGGFTSEEVLNGTMESFMQNVESAESVELESGVTPEDPTDDFPFPELESKEITTEEFNV